MIKINKLYFNIMKISFRNHERAKIDYLWSIRFPRIAVTSRFEIKGGKRTEAAVF